MKSRLGDNDGRGGLTLIMVTLILKFLVLTAAALLFWAGIKFSGSLFMTCLENWEPAKTEFTSDE